MMDNLSSTEFRGKVNQPVKLCRWLPLLLAFGMSCAIAQESPTLLNTLGSVFGGGGSVSSVERTLTVVASSEKRVALVIGNSQYKESPLKNPANDAADIAEKLRKLNFEVLEKRNLVTRQIGGTLREFRSKLSPGAVALVFYAGHGLQIRGENYLPAIDAEINSEEDVPNQSLSIKQLMDVLEESKTRLNLVFLDACRNNPYARSFRSSDRGLARVSAPSGTLISYATRPGSVASDGPGRNGLYTSQLLKQMDRPDQPIEQVLKRVVSEVKAASEGKQEPWMEGSIEGDFCFGSCGVTASVASPGTELARVRSPEAIEDDLWDSVKGSTAPALINEYLRQFPSGRYVGQANVALAKLAANPVQTTIVATSAPSTFETDPETAMWAEVKASGSKEYYEAYLKQYAKGKYVALARLELKRLEDRALAQKAQQERDAFASARNANTHESYAAFIAAYPQSINAGLAQAAQEKLKREARNRLRPGQTFKDCADCPDMVVIPAGSFQMGSNTGDADETPLHNVNVRSFAIGKTEVTQGQWQALMGSNPSQFKQCGSDCPVESVSWEDAQSFVKKLGAKTGKLYRLPSEAEWEYACRSGGGHTYCGSDNLDAVAWYGAFGSPPGNSSKMANRVATKQANAFGLYDMSGNVWEWTEDCWNGGYAGAPGNGTPWITGDCAQHVLRGGSWGNESAFARAAFRDGIPSSGRSSKDGFRPARELP